MGVSLSLVLQSDQNKRQHTFYSNIYINPLILVMLFILTCIVCISLVTEPWWHGRCRGREEGAYHPWDNAVQGANEGRVTCVYVCLIHQFIHVSTPHLPCPLPFPPSLTRHQQERDSHIGCWLFLHFYLCYIKGSCSMKDLWSQHYENTGEALRVSGTFWLFVCPPYTFLPSFPALVVPAFLSVSLSLLAISKLLSHY